MFDVSGGYGRGCIYVFLWGWDIDGWGLSFVVNVVCCVGVNAWVESGGASSS